MERVVLVGMAVMKLLSVHKNAHHPRHIRLSSQSRAPDGERAGTSASRDCGCLCFGVDGYGQADASRAQDASPKRHWLRQRRPPSEVKLHIGRCGCPSAGASNTDHLRSWKREGLLGCKRDGAKAEQLGNWIGDEILCLGIIVDLFS